MPTKKKKKSMGRKSSSRGRKSAPRSRARKAGASRSKKSSGRGGRSRRGSRKSSRGSRSKRPTIAKVMQRVKTSGSKRSKSRGGILKKATDFALNTAESALDSIL